MNAVDAVVIAVMRPVRNGPDWQQWQFQKIARFDDIYIHVSTLFRTTGPLSILLYSETQVFFFAAQKSAQKPNYCIRAFVPTNLSIKLVPIALHTQSQCTAPSFVAPIQNNNSCTKHTSVSTLISWIGILASHTP